MPTPAVHSVADYKGLLQRLLPRGRAWPRQEDAVQTVTLSGLALAPQRVDAAACGLITATFPSTATYMLSEWEQTLGLPARFGGPVGSTAQRRADVVAALTGLGGQSIAYFISYAAQLGYTITIEQQMQWDCEDDCDAPINGIAWAFAWQVNVPIGTDVTRLTNMLNLYKPAHTKPFIVFF